MFHIDQLHKFEKDQTTVQTLFFKIHVFNTIVNRIFEAFGCILAREEEEETEEKSGFVSVWTRRCSETRE